MMSHSRRNAHNNYAAFTSTTTTLSKTKTPIETVEITTIPQLHDHWADVTGQYRRRNKNNDDAIDYDKMIRAASVKGDTQIIGNNNHVNYTHPVLRLLHERRRRREDGVVVENKNENKNKKHNDPHKLALCIEGGGMRGCISAGMVSAIHYLNLTDCFDVMYGSSAGAVVGSYLITGQIQWFGPEVYYDQLTTAGRNFIDTRRLLRAVGLGLLDPRLLRDVTLRRGPKDGKPVVNLPYLLKRTVMDAKPLNWTLFAERQQSLPLTIMTSALQLERSIPLSMANGAFSTLDELTDCMHASCLLPGIAGPVMNLDRRVLRGERIPPGTRKMVLGNNLASSKEQQYEPLADSLVYEPLPFRTAIGMDNCTHCVVIRSVPDGLDVSGKGSVFQTMIMKRFFVRKNKLPHQYERMKKHLHKKSYSEDVLFLNEKARDDRDPADASASSPQLMTMALPPGSEEIGRLEVGRAAIFDGIRRGFARAYDCLVEDPALRGRGMDVAREFFPDAILDYDPRDYTNPHNSAYAEYLESRKDIVH
jgi:predicted acylesterase/phospholipase RssA